MTIEKISLLHFRNFDELSIQLHPGINIFYGNNAQGKTNFLESIYFCGTGRSHRSRYDKELIQFHQTEAHIQGWIQNDQIKDRIDIHLKSNEKKGIAINGLPIKKIGDLFGLLLIVIFSPEDLSLIKSGPSERRRFMDIELCQMSKSYYYNLQQYYKVLKQRNVLLKKIQKDRKLMDTLEIWDEQLTGYGLKIIEARTNFVEKISLLAQQIHFSITDEKETLHIFYRPNTSLTEYKEKLKRNWERDLILGTTTVGIHKDDLSFCINDMDARVYGSQGQQRTCSLSCKLAEIKLIQEEKNQTPVLLLDDVFSELDVTRQRFLLENISDIQTIITCTGVEDILAKMIHKSYIFKVENGLIAFEKENFVV